MRFKDQNKLETLYYLLTDYHKYQRAIETNSLGQELEEILRDSFADFLPLLLEREATEEDLEHFNLEEVEL